MEKMPALSGIKIVEFAHVIAGPLAGTLMADLGADVVHVEDPKHGDPGRHQGPAKDGVHLWWKVSGRNKRSVTLDLRAEEGQAVARQLVGWADVVITNFRVDTLSKWGLDWEGSTRSNPRAVMLQITGNGVDHERLQRARVRQGRRGPQRRRPRHRLPRRSAGPHRLLPRRHHHRADGRLRGLRRAGAAQRPRLRGRVDRPRPQRDPVPPDRVADHLLRPVRHRRRTRAGNTLEVAPGAVVNTYLTADEVWLTVTSATPRSVRNIAELLGLPLDDYQTAAQQAERKSILDTVLA